MGENVNNKNAVEFIHVDKIYKLENKDHRHFTKKREFYALRDITFNIERGDVIGVLGTNGSGKSTLSTILAGISAPTHGDVKVYGEQALIAVKSGMNEQLTGIENINLKGALLGLTKKEIKRIQQDVMDFAELGDFIYQPVKKYSSGMKARLGFSISIALDPDILIVDEALSVGDKAFAAKCLDYMNELKDEGKTVFFISHSIQQVREFCKNAIWIEAGELKAVGEVNELCDRYEEHVEMIKQLSKKEKNEFKEKIFESRLIK